MNNFLINSDNTGRFIVTSLVTNKKYYVEPIGFSRTDWGDIDPATKKVTGSYGKYRGSIDEKDSMITEENGFDKIHYAINPMDKIRELDEN